MEETQKAGSFLPDKAKILSGSCLKVIAVVTMFIDHIAFVFLLCYPPAIKQDINIFGSDHSVYELLRDVGRIAFPIFCFLLIEGFEHTHDRKKYGVNLFVFALISELPWNLVHTGTIFCGTQNVFFTLFLGYIGMCIIEKYKNEQAYLAVYLITMLVISIIFQADYGASGFGFIIMMYVTRKKPVIQAITGSCFLSSTWIAGLAFIPINLYNGKRGFIKSKAAKYIFYAVYPVHMLILFLIKYISNGYS
ncbi:MAG: TraX family protein [Oscillospiraceae bacterium]|nr:TraX family protein [Oscillospiraceae bacterium]